MKNRRCLILTFTAALLVSPTALIRDALAQAYPVKPVRVVVANAAGGGVDTVIRIVAQRLSESTRQTFVVENRPGAAGNIAYETAARAAPDGYTLLASTPTIINNPTIYGKAPYKIGDFLPISLLGTAPLLLVVHPSLPVHSVADLVKLAKAKPGAIRFGGSYAATPHLSQEMLAMMTGIKLMHVPYKGGPQTLNDVMSGQIEMTMLAFAETLPQVRAGRVRALAQSGEKRSPLAPDIPTVHEAGVKGYSSGTWYIVFAPAGVPPEVPALLHGEILKALKQSDVRERLQKAGVAEIIGATPEETSQFVKRETVRWEKVIRASGIKAE
jgi:tripartite-type tricarboxylate transporter receptor subunit TctC